MPELTDILVHHPDCTAREVGEGLVIMLPENSSTHSLDVLGAFIWNQWDGKRSLSDILATILSEYDVAEEMASGDLISFAGEMQEAGLVQVV